jgi:hypothetical protein
VCLLRGTDWVFMCFVWIWEQTAIISLYSINWLVFITETESVYCAVGLCLYVFCVDLRTNSDYFPIQHWLVCITETQCVYFAVRSEPLNKIQVAFVFKLFQTLAAVFLVFSPLDIYYSLTHTVVTFRSRSSFHLWQSVYTLAVLRFLLFAAVYMLLSNRIIGSVVWGLYSVADIHSATENISQLYTETTFFRSARYWPSFQRQMITIHTQSYPTPIRSILTKSTTGLSKVSFTFSEPHQSSLHISRVRHSVAVVLPVLITWECSSGNGVFQDSGLPVCYAVSPSN